MVRGHWIEHDFEMLVGGPRQVTTFSRFVARWVSLTLALLLAPPYSLPTVDAVESGPTGVGERQVGAADSGVGLLILRDGEVLSGRLVESDNDALIHWKGDAFCDPFVFRQRALEKLVFSRASALADILEDHTQPLVDEYIFEFQNGDVVRGGLVKWDRRELVIRHAMAGDLRFHADDLKWVRRGGALPEDAMPLETAMNSNRGLVWRGFYDPEAILSDASENRRNDSGKLSGWTVSGSVIASESSGSKLIREVMLPPRLFINLELEWEQQADFALCIRAPTRVDENPESQRDEQPKQGIAEGVTGTSRQESWRVETAGSDLVMVFELGDDVDVGKIASMDEERRIRFSVYLDLVAGSMEILSDNGQSLGEIRRNVDLAAGSHGEHEGSNPRPLGRLELENFSGSLRVRYLEVAQWKGEIARVEADLGDENFFMISTVEQDSIVGDVVGFDAETGEISISTASSEQVKVAISQVAEVRRRSRNAGADKEKAVLQFDDDSRLTGDVREIRAGRFVLSSELVSGQIELPFAAIREVRFSGSGNGDIQEAAVVGRIGKLITSGSQVSGRLVAETKTMSANANDEAGIGLSWHPLRSLVSSRIKKDVSAEIRFSEQAAQKTSDAGAKLLEQQRVRNQRLRRGLNFGQLFLERTDLSKRAPATRGSHLVHFRSGDVLRCRVQSISERNVRVEVESDGASDAASEPSETTNQLTLDIEQRLIKAIEFVSNSPPPSLDQAKKQRLLTIPRLQKSDPPSHLLCSHNGDFLRCQLVEMRDDFLTVEVQLNRLRLPSERIAQLIWFHPDEYGQQLEVSAAPVVASGDRLDTREAISGEDRLGAGSADRDKVDSETAASRDSTRPDYTGLVQAVLNDGKRTTFTATGLDGDMLRGRGQWAGVCSFDLGRVDELLLGNAIVPSVADVSYNQWRFQAATEPLVSAVLEGQMGNPGQSEFVGQLVPNLPLRALDGSAVKLSEYRGDWLLIDFWTTWSAASVQAIPSLESIRKEYQDLGLLGLSVSVEESLETVSEAVGKYERSSRVVVDIDGKFAEQFGVNVLPQVVLVNPEGKIESVHLGGGDLMLSKVLSAVAQRLDLPSE